MKNVLIAAAVMLFAPGVALAQVAVPPTPHGASLPLSLSGDEVDKVIADLQDGDLYLKVPGGFQAYVPTGNRQVLMMLTEKENALRAEKEKAGSAPPK